MAVSANVLLESNWRQLLGDQIGFLLAFWLGIMVILPYSTRWAARMHAEINEASLRGGLKGLFALLSLSLLTAAWLAR